MGDTWMGSRRRIGAAGLGDLALLLRPEVGVGVVTTLRRRFDDGVDVIAGASTSIGSSRCVDCCCCRCCWWAWQFFCAPLLAMVFGRDPSITNLLSGAISLLSFRGRGFFVMVGRREEDEGW